MGNKKYLSIGFLVVCVVVASFFLYNAFAKKSGVKVPSQTETNVEEGVPVTSEVGAPSVTPEAVRVKGSPGKVITATVDITDTKVTPANLEAVPFTMVTFNNKSSKAIKIVSENFGTISLAPGEKSNQLLDKAENYSYTITGLAASLTGEIVVK